MAPLDRGCAGYRRAWPDAEREPRCGPRSQWNPGPLRCAADATHVGCHEGCGSALRLAKPQQTLTPRSRSGASGGYLQHVRNVKVRVANRIAAWARARARRRNQSLSRFVADLLREERDRLAAYGSARAASVAEIPVRLKRTCPYSRRGMAQDRPGRPSAGAAEPIPLEEDPLYRAKALGRSTDGLPAEGHDQILYGQEREWAQVRRRRARANEVTAVPASARKRQRRERRTSSRRGRSRGGGRGGRRFASGSSSGGSGRGARRR